MGFIQVVERSKPKKKPGWQLKQAEYQAWLDKINGQKTNFSANNRSKVVKAPVKETSPSTTVSTFLPKSFEAFKGGGTVKVARPEIEYADNPELLERELRARERKFNVAPAYNKGGDVFVTEEELANQLRGNKRRP